MARHRAASSGNPPARRGVAAAGAARRKFAGPAVLDGVRLVVFASRCWDAGVETTRWRRGGLLAKWDDVRQPSPVLGGEGRGDVDAAVRRDRDSGAERFDFGTEVSPDVACSQYSVSKASRVGTAVFVPGPDTPRSGFHLQSPSLVQINLIFLLASKHQQLPLGASIQKYASSNRKYLRLSSRSLVAQCPTQKHQHVDGRLINKVAKSKCFKDGQKLQKTGEAQIYEAE